MEKQTETKKKVESFYGNNFSKTDEKEKSSSCVLTKSNKGFVMKQQSKIHPDLQKKNYGCGCTIPPADIAGSTVLDLGSGGGRDCFVLSSLVGDSGRVIGVDMTDAALKVAESFKEYHKNVYGLKNDVVEFKKSVIEDLKTPGIKCNSVDLVVSNCVINLSTDKKKVFSEIYRVLKDGGELYFSDVYASCRVPDILRKDKSLWSQCVSGSMYFEDFRVMMRNIGFYVTIVNAKVVFSGISEKIKIKLQNSNPEVIQKLKETNPMFYSITIRAFKMEKGKLENGEEDYGHTVTFLGDKYQDEFVFDNDLDLKKGVETKVSSNIYYALKASKYAKFFKFSCECSKKIEHRGRFKRRKLWDIIEDAENSYDGGNLFNGNNLDGKKGCCGGGEVVEEKKPCCGGVVEEKKESCCDNCEFKDQCCGKKEEKTCDDCEFKEQCCKEKKKCCETKKEEEKKESCCCGGK